MLLMDTNGDAKSFYLSPATASLIGGTVGGIAGVISGHPFDTIKVRLQSQNPSAPIYRGTLHCAVTIVRKESVLGLFKGMLSPLIGVAAVNSLLFGVYGAFLDIQRLDKTQSPNLTQIFIAGSGSGMVNSLISTPMELIKIQLQNQGSDPGSKKIFKGPMDCLSKIYSNVGLRGLYRGFPVTFIRETPSYGAYFVSYELFCRMLKQENQELSGWRLMLAGGLGGVVGWTSTYPFDVAKTIIQADKNILDRRHKPVRMMDCLALIYKQNGVRALFRGLFATIIRAFPTNVAILTSWQLTMNYFRDHGWIQEIPPTP